MNETTGSSLSSRRDRRRLKFPLSGFRPKPGEHGLFRLAGLPWLVAVAVLAGFVGTALVLPNNATASHPTPTLPLTQPVPTDCVTGDPVLASDAGVSRVVSGTNNRTHAGTVGSFAVWANATSFPKQEVLDISGNDNVIDGLTRSQSHIKLSGSRNQFRHGTQYGAAVTATGKSAFEISSNDNCFSPAPTQNTTTTGFPITFNLADYQFGGSQATAAMLAGRYYACPAVLGSTPIASPLTCSSGKISGSVQGSELPTGLYYAGEFDISASNLTATVTFVTPGKLKVSGSNQTTFNAYTQNLLFFSNLGTPNVEDTGVDAIDISGQGSTFNGITYAPRGEAELSGSQNSFLCPVLGDRVKINGNLIYISGGCAPPPPPEVGTIVIVKDTVPNADVNFGFTDNIPGCTVGPLNDDGVGTENTVTCTNVAVGTYGVTENDPTSLGYALTALSCESTQGGDTSTTSLITRTATIVLNDGETVTCTFKNEPLPSLVISKTPDGGAPGTINVGQNAVFTITVTNNGPGTANNVTLVDTLPGTGWSDNSASCTITTATNDVLNCNFGNLTNGQSASVTVSRATTDPADCGTLTNPNATAQADNHGPVTDSGSINVLCPDEALLTISKTPDGGTITAGQNAVFTIVISNVGQGTAENVTLFDVLPGSGWSIASQPAGNPCSISSGNTLSCVFGDLVSGATRTVSVQRSTTTDNCGPLNNFVSTVDDDNHSAVTDSGSITVLCPGTPQLTISKSPDGGSIIAGQNALFSITVSNIGSATATSVTLSDLLPGGNVWSIVSQPAGNPCTIVSGFLACDFGSLAAGQSVTVTVQRATTTANCGTINNLATANASNASFVADVGSINVLSLWSPRSRRLWSSRRRRLRPRRWWKRY